MLDKAKTLRSYRLRCRDGEIGSVKEFYFDDQYWTIRYLVADTGSWLPGRQVLISPYALRAVSREKRAITIDLSRQRMEHSPALSSDKPVSRQFEAAYCEYYGWPLYWRGPYKWGQHPNLVRDPEQWRAATPGEKAWDACLRRANDVNGHHFLAADGELGHVDDLLVDDQTWAIRYLVIDTRDWWPGRNWWPGKKVLVSPRWIERVSWSAAKVFVQLPRETINRAPEYSEQSQLTRDYETRLHGHYNRRGYWVDEPTAT